MAIKKCKLNYGFTIIPTQTLQDESISLNAKGLLVYLLSLPPEWIVHKTEIRTHIHCMGRDKFDKVFKELVVAGYIRKALRQKDNGYLDGVDWIVYYTKDKPEVSCEQQLNDVIDF